MAAFVAVGRSPTIRGETTVPGDAGRSAGFSLCTVAASQNCVFDGDTIRLDGAKIRLADIDAPETHEPKCAAEAVRGAAATRRLVELMNDGPVELRPIDRDEDRYGRKLRIVERDGRSLGEALVREGLARRWSGTRQGWCG